MECPTCQHENRLSARFCAQCRAPLPKVCPECHTEVARDDRFCDACGAALPAAACLPSPVEPPSLEEEFATFQQVMPASFREQLLTQTEGELRVVTVLFADMSRSVETTQDLSPEEGATLVNRLLRVMVDALLKYEGRVDRFLGDGVLAVFGAPKAHESDPERAVFAALEMREAAAALGMEITGGINSGEVYVGGVGSERHEEVTVMGPVVSLAARLQRQAEPGQILAGEATYRQARGTFEFAPRRLHVKGIAEPVTVYAVGRPRPRAEKARGIEGLRSPLIGRERERVALLEAAETLAKERRGQIVCVVGEAGIGKTRLVSELKTYLQEKEPTVRWLEGRCVSIGQSASFWPFIDMMRIYLGISGEHTEKEIAAALVGAMTELFGQDAEGVIPYVGQMLSVKLEKPYQERLQYAAPEQIRRQTLLRMRDFLVALARRQPLVVVLEDLHWADELSLDLLWGLMDELVAAPILLVCVYRPEQDHGCWKIDSAASSKHLERYTPIRLKPLTRQESQQMVEALLMIPNLPPAGRAALLENTQGNPFFVEEVVRLLIERGVIYQQEGRWMARDGPEALSVPDTVKSVILSRVDRLEGEVRRVLQCASVIGRVFRHRLLEYLCDRKELLEQNLAQLEAHELVYRERSLPELEYAFKHVLTQETAYEAMLARHRKAFHERVGKAIELLYQEQVEECYELLAFHYSRSDNREKAIEYLEKAAQKAAARYANHEALEYFEQALRLSERSERYDRILTRRAKLLVNLYRGHEAATDYERLLQSARQQEDRSLEMEALLGLAAAHYLIALDDPASHSPARSWQLYGAAYRLASELGDKAGMVRALLPLPQLADCGQGSHQEVHDRVREALSLSQQIDDEELILDCKLALGMCGDELLAQLEARHDLHRLNRAYWRLLVGHLWARDYQQAVRCCDTAIRLAREIGVPPVMYPSHQAMALVCLGRYGEVWSALQDEVADPAHRLGAGMKDLATGEFMIELRAYEQAVEVAHRAIEQGRLLSRSWMSRWGQILLVTSLLRSGKLDAATLADISSELDAGGWPLPAELVAEVCLADGRTDQALRHAEEAIAARRKDGHRFELVIATEMKLRALTQLGRAAEALAPTEEALAMAEEQDYLPLVWRLREAKALALTALGETDAAAASYSAAAAVLETLAERIEDADLRQRFVSHPQAASVLTAAGRGPETPRSAT